MYSGKRILVFAGTFEGHRLAREFLKRKWQKEADFCVATEYGAEMLADLKELSVKKGRLNRREMESLLSTGDYGLVIDATHPYAREVTENLRTACETSGTEYLRLLRASGNAGLEGVHTVSSIGEAVALLNDCTDRVLLTTGAKELEQYRGIKNLQERVIARILPSTASIEQCLRVGIPSGHIVAMQGPFTREMNVATMKQYGCTILVTKNTGKPGGFDDKLACLKEGFQIVVIDRPTVENGLSYDEVISRVEVFYGE